MAIDARPTRSAPDDDPYLWLEAVDGAEALAWTAKMNAETLERFGGARLLADQATVKSIFDRPDNIPHVSRRAGLLYNFWRDAGQPRGLWRRTGLASFRSDAPDWDVLLDLDALAESEGEDWVWAGAATLPPRHDRAMISLSRGGGDAVVLREFDLGARAFVPGGFESPAAKGGAAWLDEDTLLLASAYGDGMATEAGYARCVRRWRRGEPAAGARVLFETEPSNMAVMSTIDRTRGRREVWFAELLTFFESRHYLGDESGPGRVLDLPRDASFEVFRGRIALTSLSDWPVGGATFPKGSLLVGAVDDLAKGDPNFEMAFEPSERRALQSFFWTSTGLVVSILDNLAPVVESLDFEAGAGGGWARRRLPGLPAIGSASVHPLDREASESDGALLSSTQDPLTPPTLSLLSPEAAPVVLKRAPRAFRPDGLVATRHEAVSVDGARIPYTQVGPADAEGDAPVRLTAYGGFLVSLLPSYRATLGKLWLERGGVGVVANIRGGGEFGPGWHEAGRREGKKLSHVDFAAVAADLVRRGVTTPERIAAEGGSNGGLLIANMLTRYPERFGALLCTVPLIDMRRYSKLLAGASWVAEYGDPAVEGDWAFLSEISAYQNAEPGRPYPPILLATTRTDDRVHPGHARKMAAKLRAMGYENACYYESEGGGHGAGRDSAEMAAFIALGFEFLRRSIGWDPQDS